MSILDNVPAWVVPTALELLGAAAKLARGRTPEEREEALMEAAEAIKAARDQAKFGGG